MHVLKRNKLNKKNKIYLKIFLLKNFIFLFKTTFYSYLFFTHFFLSANFNFCLVINRKLDYFLIIKNFNFNKLSFILYINFFYFTKNKKIIFLYNFNKNDNFLYKYTKLFLLTTRKWFEIINK
jgi:hypothetical protein